MVIKRITPLVLLLLLFACSSDDSTDTGKRKELPAAQAQPEVTMTAVASADEGEEVTLTITVVADELASGQWKQTAGTAISLFDGGIDGGIEEPNSLIGTTNKQFVAPEVENSETVSFELTVTNTRGASASASVSIHINSVNNPPVAHAGDNQQAPVLHKVMLSAAASNDREDNNTDLRYEWSQAGDSHEGVELTDNDKPVAYFMAPAVTVIEELTFAVTVTDSQGLSDSDEVSVFVMPRALNAAWSGTDNQFPCDTSADQTACQADLDNTDVLNSDSDGDAGFSFTKIDDAGTPLLASAQQWFCVRDNVTGLVWQVQTGGSDLPGANHGYT